MKGRKTKVSVIPSTTNEAIISPKPPANVPAPAVAATREGARGGKGPRASMARDQRPVQVTMVRHSPIR